MGHGSLIAISHHLPAKLLMHAPPSGRPTSFPLIKTSSALRRFQSQRKDPSEKSFDIDLHAPAAAVAVRRQKAAVPVVKAPKARRKAYAADAIAD